MTRDPIGYAGGADVYAYCDQDPVGGVDPGGVYGAGVHFYLTKDWLRLLGLPFHTRHVIADWDWNVDRLNNGRSDSRFPTAKYHMANYYLGVMRDFRPDLIDQHYKCAQEAARQHNPMGVWINLGICLHIKQDTIAHGDNMMHPAWLVPNRISQHI